MTRARPVLLLVLLGGLLAPPAAGPAAAGGVDRAQRAREATQVLDDLERLYPFFDLKDLRADWRARRREWAVRARALDDDRALLLLVREAIGCLRDAHMGLRDAAVELPEPPARFHSGLYFGEAQGGKVCLVTDLSRVYPDARPGREVVAIDGQDARRWLDERSRALWEAGGAFSSPQRAALLVWRWGLRGEEGESHRVTVLDGRRRREFTARNTLRCSAIPETEPKVDGAVPVEGDGSVRWRRLDDALGYLYLRQVSGRTDASVARALAAMPGVRGVVVDLGDNGGGGGYALTSLQPFAGRIAALVSPRTFSAGETYARDLVTTCRARLFGEVTAGSSSAKAEYALPRALGTVVYSTRSRTGIEKPIEYHGIAPHERVVHDPEDLAQGRSTLLAAAVAWLERTLR